MTDWTKLIRQPFCGRDIPAYLHGVIVPMFTPCNADYSLDEAGIRSYTDYLINLDAVTTLFPRCGLGRMYAFSYDETKQLIDIVLDEAAGRKPVMPGTTGMWNKDPKNKPDPKVFTRQSIELSQYAQERGATAVVLVMPEALPMVDGVDIEDTMFDYFKAVAAEIDLPIVIYRPPGLSMDYEITPRLLSRLLTIPQIAGMKYSTDRVATLMGLAMAIPDDSNFGLIAGDELAYYFVIPIGASGVIGQGCDTNPEVLRAIYDCMIGGDLPGATEAAKDAMRAGWACDGNPNDKSPEGYNVDAALSGLMYAARKGAKVQPYTKGPSRPISKERMDVFEREMDALRAKYRK